VETMKSMSAFVTTSTNIERLAEKFVALCMDDKKKIIELDASVFVADVIHTKYRFARDPVQKDSKLMFFNGVVYKYARDDDVFVYARHAVVDLIDGALKSDPLLHQAPNGSKHRGGTGARGDARECGGALHVGALRQDGACVRFSDSRR
jgi:hypothetical protein